MKDLGVVIDELGMKWEGLTRNQKAYLATAIAGNRQSSRFYALMNNYDRTLELVAEGTNSAGSAQHQYELYTKSLQASLNKLTNESEKFFNQLTKGNGIIKFTVDILTSLVKVLNTLGPLASTAGVVALLNSLSSFKTNKKVFEDLFNLNRIAGTNKIDLTTFNAKYANNAEALNIGKRFSTGFSFGQSIQSKYAKITNPWNNLIDKIFGGKQELSNEIPNVAENANEFNTEEESTRSTIVDGTNNVVNAIKDLCINVVNKMNELKNINKSGNIEETVNDIVSNDNFKTLDSGKISSKSVKTFLEGTKAGGVGKLTGILHSAGPMLLNAAKSFLKAAGPMALAGIAIKGTAAVVKKLNANFGWTASAAAGKAENYSNDTKQLKELGARYEELAMKVNRTAEEEKELDQITIKLKTTNQNLNKSLDITNKNYQKNISLIKNATKESEKLEAQWRKIANNKEYDNFWKNIGKWISNRTDEYIYFVTDNEDTLNSLKSTGQSLWYNQAGYVSTEYGLNDKQNKALNEYVAKKIDDQMYTYVDYEIDLREATADFEKVSKALLAAGETESNKFAYLQSLGTNNNSNFNQWRKEINNTSLTSEYKELIEYEVEEYLKMLRRISNNTGIEFDKLKDVETGILNNFLNVDLSNFSIGEINDYYNDINEILTDTEKYNEFKIANETGSVNQLLSTWAELGEVSYTLLDAFQNLNDGATITSQLLNASKGLDTSMNNLKDIIGGLSQTNILEKIEKGELNLQDVTVNSLGELNISGVSSVITGLKNSKDAATEAFDQQISQVEELRKARVGEIFDLAVNSVADVERTKAMENYFGIGNARDIKESTLGTKEITSSEAQRLNIINDLGIKEEPYDKKTVEEKALKGDFDAYEETISNLNDMVTKTKENINNGIYILADGFEQYGSAVGDTYAKMMIDDENYFNSLSKIKEQWIENKKAIEDYYDKQIKLVDAYEDVFAMSSNVNSLLGELDAFGEIKKAAEDGLDLREELDLLAKYPTEMASLYDQETGLIDASTQSIKKNTEESIQNTQNKINGKVLELQAENEVLQKSLDNIDTMSDEELQYAAQIMAQNKAEQESQANTFKAEALGLTNSLANWESWSEKVRKAISDVNEAIITTIDNASGKTKNKKVDLTSHITGTSFDNDTTIDIENSDDIINNISSWTDEYRKTLKQNLKDQKEDIQKKIDSNNAEILILNRYSSKLESLKEDPTKYSRALDNGSSSSGSDLNDIEKFYYYLKMIEKLEKEISQLEAKQDFKDSTSEFDYDTSHIQEQIMLLKEEVTVYDQLAEARSKWLVQERAAIAASYSWAHFTEDGMLYYDEGIKISSEEQERVNEYVSQWEDNLDAVQRKQEAINKQVEQIKNYYDKINKSITDALDGMDKSIGHTDWWAKNGFTNEGKIKSQVHSMTQMKDAIKLVDNSIRDAETAWNEAYVSISQNDWGEYLKYNSYTNSFEMTEQGNALEKTNKTLYEKIQTAKVDYNGAVKAYEDNMSKMESYYESIQNQIQTWKDSIQGIVDAWYSEIDSVFKEIDKQISDIDLSAELNGADGKDVKKKQDLLLQKVADSQTAYDTFVEIQKEYGEMLEDEFEDYIYYVEGEMKLNEAAVQSSTDMTEEKKRRFEYLSTMYEIYGEKIEETYESLTEAEKAWFDELSQQRDNYIDLITEISNELKEIDQEELDDLRKKYDEMKALDDEYYNSLEKKISKQRQKREDEQKSTNINQLQQRIAVLQRDNSGSYSSELASLQQQLREQLQEQADTNVDRELERIKEEQDEREKARQLEETQLENLISFKEENRMYWEAAQEIYEGGVASITDFLGTRYQDEDIDNDEMIKKTEEANKKAINAYNTNAHTIGDSVGNIYEVAKEMVSKTDASEAIKELVDGLTASMNDVQDESNNLWKKIEDQVSSWYLYWIKTQTVNELKANSDAWWRAYQIGDEDAMNQLSEVNQKLIDSLNEVLAEHGLEQYIRNDAGIWATSDGRALYLPNQYAQTQDKYAASYNNLHDEEYRRDRGEVTESEMKQGARAILDAKEGWANAKTQTEKDTLANDALRVIKNLDLPWSRDENGNWHASDGTIMSLEYLKHLAGYSTGGLVDYTGLAMVHGSQNSPEAFLNAKQTQLFAQLRDRLVADNYSYNGSSNEATGDTININGIEIAVKELAEVEDINKIVNTIKQSIYKDATSGRSLKLNRR